MAYMTPENREESSGLGFLGYGAIGAGLLGGMYALGKNPKTLLAMGSTLSAAKEAIYGITGIAKQSVMEEGAKAPGILGAAFQKALKSPAATRALAPDLFGNLRGMMQAYEAGVYKSKIRTAIADKFGNAEEIIPGVSNLSVSNVLDKFQNIRKDTPFQLHGYELSKTNVELLKKAREAGLVDDSTIVDKGLFYSKDALIDATLFRPENWGKKILQGIHGLTGGVLTDTLFPSSHLFSKVPDIAEFSSKSLGDKVDQDSVRRAFKVGDEFFGVTKDRELINVPKVKLGPVGNSISQAHAVRQGFMRHQTVEEMKEAGIELGAIEEKLAKAAENEYFSALVGIGPQYASEKAIPSRIINWYQRFYDTDIKPVSMLPGKTIEETWQEMPWGEKLLASVKKDTDSILWARESEIGSAATREAKAIREIKRRQKQTERLTSRAPFGMSELSNAEKKAANKMGEDIASSVASEYYAYSNTDLMQNYLYASFMTPYRILSAATGLGLKHDTLVKTALRATVGVPMAGFVAWQGLNYLDFLAEETTTFSPMRGLARVYAEAQIARQSTLNLLAISYASKTAESLLGIDMDSPLMIGARSVALPLAGAALAGKHGKRTGFFIGAGIAALTATDDLAMDADELRDIYEGRQEVAIKKSRWWGLGKDPFEGGETMYYRKHMVASMLSEPSLIDAKYGGETNYWEHATMFPTPHNFFGLGILADPYWIEKQNYYERPYPVTGKSFLAELPIWGNILDTTLGSVIKPKQIMHPDALVDYMTSTPEFAGDKGLESVARQLSIQQIRPNKVMPRIEGTQDDIGHALYDITEFAGLKGFLATSLKQQITGTPDFSDSGARWESAENIYSKEGAYYDMQLGGLLGYSEFFRRFLPHSQTQIDYMNPIDNMMPSWLPGDRSDFGDRGYIDFGKGDPFTTIKEGEKRLPGKMYESIHELHSGKEGVYDDFDRMRILADVSPHSNAFKYYKNLIDGMADSGSLDDKWMNIYQNINERIGANALPEFEDQVDQKRVNTVHETMRNMFSKVIDVQIPYVSTKLLGKNPDALSDYEDRVALDNDFHDWRHPIDAMLLPYMRSQASHGTASGAIGGAALGLVSSALGGTEAGRVAKIGALAGGVWGMAGVDNPKSEYQRRSLEEYFDKLKYLKLHKLAEKAEGQGDFRLSSKLRDMQKRTIVGLDYNSNAEDFYKSAYGALPKIDRAYLQAFIQADPSKRGKILDTVPSYMQPVLMKLWQKPEAQSTGSSRVRKAAEIDAYSESLEYVNSHGGVPDDNAMLWNPDISLQDVKLKTVTNIGADIHRYGFWGTDERDVQRTRDYIKPLPFSYKSNNSGNRLLNFKQTMVQYGFSEDYSDLIRNPSRRPEDVYSIYATRNRMGDIMKFQSSSEGRY